MNQKLSAGDMLKAFRKQAGYSQLDLACEADISQRHLSFLETGRNNPSREILMQLAPLLGLGQMELNALLLAAGFAPVNYRAEENPAARPLMEAAERMLAWQAPNPALILSEDWIIRGANEAARKMVNYFASGPDLVSLNGLDIVNLMIEERFLLNAIVNMEEIQTYMQTRLRFEAPGRLAPHRILAEPEDAPRALLPLVLKRGDRVASFDTTLVTVGTAQDAAAGEVRVESFYPADAATAAFLHSLTTEAVA